MEEGKPSPVEELGLWGMLPVELFRKKLSGCKEQWLVRADWRQSPCKDLGESPGVLKAVLVGDRREG